MRSSVPSPSAAVATRTSLPRGLVSFAVSPALLVLSLFQNKRPKDYTQYAEYITETLALIGERRRAIGYQKHKSEHIEKPLKYKCAFLYQLCSDRFKVRPCY